MTNDELSNIEIKLINAALKYSRGENYSVGIKRYYNYKGNKSTIRLISPDRTPSHVIGVNYSNKAKEGKIVLGGVMALAEKYEYYLTKEIPEIKRRICLGDNLWLGDNVVWK